MKKSICFMVVGVIFALQAYSQSSSSLTLCIHDSIRTIRICKENSIVAGKFLSGIFNRKFKFRIELNNGAANEGLVVFQTGKTSLPFRSLSLVTTAERLRTDTLLINDHFHIDRHRALPKHFSPLDLVAEMELIKSVFAFDVLDSAVLFGKLASRLSVNFGLTYIIEDEDGAVVPLQSKSLSRLKKIQYTTDGFEKEIKKQQEKDISEAKSVYAVSGKGFIKTHVDKPKAITVAINYREFMSFSSVQGRFRMTRFHDLLPGKVYYVTFFYVLYPGVQYYDKTAMPFYEKAISETQLHCRDCKVFYGFAQSNRVKIIVK
jgi:hypothetical protein